MQSQQRSFFDRGAILIPFILVLTLLCLLLLLVIQTAELIRYFTTPY